MSSHRPTEREYHELLKLDTGFLLCRLGDPKTWVLPGGGGGFMASLSGWQPPVTEVRRRRISEHRKAAQDLRHWASLEHDAALHDAQRMVAEEEGRAKLQALEPGIRARLCGEWNACEQIAKYENETALTMAIGDVLMTFSSAVPVATLAVLVVKIGVKRFCNCPH